MEEWAYNHYVDYIINMITLLVEMDECSYYCHVDHIIIYYYTADENGILS